MINSIADTTIYISDFAIHEPVTVLTDYIMTSLCIYFYLQLSRIFKTDNATKYWKYFYAYMALSSFMGGCSHAFFAIHQGAGYKTFWLGMQALNIFSVYCMQQATFYSVLQKSAKRRYWNISYHIQLILSVIAVFMFHNFLVVIINTAIALIPIMIIHFKNSERKKENLWIAYGIVVLFITAAVNVSKLTLHKYFNHLDLAHVLIMINLSVMFVGVKLKALQSA